MSTHRASSSLSDDATVAALVREYEHLTRATVARLIRPGMAQEQRDELEGAARLALVQAAQSYRPGRGSAFSSWAISRIRWAIRSEALEEQSRCLSGVQKWEQIGSLPQRVAIDTPLRDASGEDGGTLADLLADPDASTEDAALTPVIAAESRAAFWRKVARLVSRRHLLILQQYYGEGRDFAEIAAGLGVTRQAVGIAHGRALETLRRHLSEARARHLS